MRRILPPLLLVFGLQACHPPTWTQPISAPPVERAARTAQPREASVALSRPRIPPAPFGSVAARLERFEGAASIQLTTGAGTLRVERRGAEVACSDGRRGSLITITPEGASGVGIEDKHYRGSMLVLPHPEGGITVVNHVPMEDYVRGVVARELAIWSAPPALLEAQAIAARSYAEAQLRGRPGKPGRTLLSDSTLDQAYSGDYLPGKGAGARAVAERLQKAVDATRNMVLVANGRVLDARFHATCGGRTASFESVFDEPDPGAMTPVDCEPCAKISPSNQPTPDGSVVWEWTAEADALHALAGSLGVGSRIRALFPVRRDNTGRWLEVRVVGDRTGHNLDTTALRQQLGFTNLKSTWIVGTHPTPGKPVEGRITFRGRGRGHGVGFCQTGARELAESGWTARSILGKYFPTATLSRISPSPAPALLRSSIGADPAR